MRGLRDDGFGDRRRRLYRQPHGLGIAGRRREAWSFSTAFRPASNGRWRRRPSWSSAMSPTRNWSARSSATTRSTPSSISPARSWFRNRSPIRSPITRTTPRKTRTLIETAVREGVPQFHLLLDRRRLWRRRAGAGARGCPPGAGIALWPVQADERMDAARRGRGPRPALHRAALLQRRRRRPEGPHRPVDAGRHASDQGRLRDGARQACLHAGVRHRLSRRRTAPACATTSMSAIWRRRIAWPCSGCAPAATSLVANCGYGHGYSVLEVIDSVRRVLRP